MLVSARLSAALILLLPSVLVPAASLAAPAKTSQSSLSAPFDVSAHTLLTTSPPASAYPNAGAITLRDESITYLNADGTDTTQVHETIKIFNERGRSYSDVSVSYNTMSQKISDLHARTILPTGQVLTVKPGDIHENSPYSDYTMYDDAKTLGFSMPGVENGSILDYFYTIKTTRAVLKNQYADTWTFQDGSDPVKMSRLEIVTPASVVLHTQMHNAPTAQASVKTVGADKIYTWELHDISGITAEPMMPPSQDYMPWLETSTLPSWQTIARWYQTLATPRMVATPEVAAIVKQLIAGKTTDTDKAKAIFYWVEGKTRYVAIELGLAAYQPHAAAQVCENRYGDCKDMATLLITMLRAAGIKTVWPVLLNAGDKTPVRTELASPGAFDHAIVRADIDGKPYWFDSTAELCSFGEIPGSDRGVDAFVIRNGVGTFETIPVGVPDNNLTVYSTSVTLHPDGSADCTMTTDTDGDDALSSRFRFRDIQPDQMKIGFQGMVSSVSPNATLKTFTLSPFNDRDKPMTFSCDYHAPLWATRVGKLLIIPGMDSSSDTFSRPTRTYPLYSDSNSKSVYDRIITLPAGYVVEDKPDDIHQTLPFGTYDTTYTLNGNVLTIHSVATTFPATVPASEYDTLKAQSEALAPLLKEPVVLHLADPVTPEATK